MQIIVLLIAVSFSFTNASEYHNTRKRYYQATQLDQDPDDLRTYIPVPDRRKIALDNSQNLKLLLDTNLYHALEFLSSLKEQEKINLICEHVTDLHRDETDSNLLHYACFSGNNKMANLLLQHMPQLAHQFNTNGQTPLDFALQYEHQDIVMLFKLYNITNQQRFSS